MRAIVSVPLRHAHATIRNPHDRTNTNEWNLKNLAGRLAIAAVGVFCFAASFTPNSAAAATDEERCLQTSVKASGQYFKCIARRNAKAILNGTTPDLTRCDTRLQGKLDALASRYGLACPDFDQIGVPSQLTTCLEDVTADLTADRSVNIVFVSSSKHSAGSINGWTGQCNARAQEAGLPGVGTYKAWVSRGPDTEARDVLVHSPRPYVRVDGVRIADDWDDLIDGSLHAPISFYETGELVVNTTHVWTGTRADGSLATNEGGFDLACLHWANEHIGTPVVVGDVHDAGPGWTEGDIVGCNGFRSVYCIQQHATATPTATPTPTPTPTPTAPPVNFIFVSSSKHSAGSINGWSGQCNARAQEAGLPGVGTYKAWVSRGPDTEARDVLVHSPLPYVRVDGVRVADNWDDLVDGTLQAPISFYETGELVVNTTHVWTGTRADGSLATNAGGFDLACLHWANEHSGTPAVVGDVHDAGLGWSEGDIVGCNGFRSVYCIQQQEP